VYFPYDCSFSIKFTVADMLSISFFGLCFYRKCSGKGSIVLRVKFREAPNMAR
jgi:hypothetical protein